MPHLECLEEKRELRMKLGSSGGVAVASFALAAIASAAIGTAPASAQELVRIPSLSYASDAEVSSLARTGFIISPDWSLSDEVNLGGTGGALLDDAEGWAIGAKLGYDQQIGNVVVGVMTDGSTRSPTAAAGAGRGLFKSELDYYGTVRGRLGYSFGRLMAYGTAGYAYGELEVTDTRPGGIRQRDAQRLDLRRRSGVFLEPGPQPARRLPQDRFRRPDLLVAAGRATRCRRRWTLSTSA